MKHLVAAILFLMGAVLVGYILLAVVIEARGEPREFDIYSGIPIDARLLDLDKRALDEAYHHQLLKLWGVWLTEGAKDAKFFQTGLANARRAYNQATQQIARREREYNEQLQRR